MVSLFSVKRGIYLFDVSKFDSAKRFFLVGYILFLIYSECRMYEVGLLDEAVKFLTSLKPKMRAKAFRTIDLLRNFGVFLKMPHAKKIEGEENLFELRVQQASNIVRLFYFHHLGKAYIITSGYVKKDMKLDKREINKAVTIRAKFLQGDDL